jgi:hypothetical protein
MRLMLTFAIPVETGNTAYTDGSLGKTIEKLLEDTSAEAAYFTLVDGERGGMIFFEESDSARIPQIVEPVFTALGAHIEIVPVLNAEELKRGIGG